MSNILNIKRNGLNFSSFLKAREVDETSLQEVEKAAVYVDNATNRKLGRVGQPYKKSEKVNKEKNEDFKIGNILSKSEVLGKATGDRLNAIIDYAELEISKDASDEEKRKSIANAYIKSAKLTGSPAEVADSLDELVEDALSDYVPKKENISNILSKSETLGKAKGKRLDAIIKYAEIEVPKDASDEEKRNLIAKSYIKSAELEGSEEEIANSLDELVEDALSDISSK